MFVLFLNKKKIFKIFKKIGGSSRVKGESPSRSGTGWSLTTAAAMIHLKAFFSLSPLPPFWADRHHPLSPTATTALLTVDHTRTHAYIPEGMDREIGGYKTWKRKEAQPNPSPTTSSCGVKKKKKKDGCCCCCSVTREDIKLHHPSRKAKLSFFNRKRRGDHSNGAPTLATPSWSTFHGGAAH